eukprot:120056_1
MSLCTFWLLCICNVLANKPNIIFLMVDEMDGRNMDKGSPDQYNAIQMRNLRALASQGTQFVRHYTNGPLCVPGRSALFTGRRTNDIHVYNNGFGIAAMSNGTLDSQCVKDYNKTKCQQMSVFQSINYTILDAMESLGYNVYIYGKLHIGAGIMQMPSQANATVEAFTPAGNLFTFSSITRSANIFKKYYNESNSAGPINSINDTYPNPHPQDATITSKCIQRLNNLANSANSNPFMLYCSLVVPHPPYQTNSTWLEGVYINKITIPDWNRTNYNEFDTYTSLYRNLWDENYSNEQLIDFRKTYYGLNVQADYLIGQVINASYLNGFNLTNTYFVFTSDHGDMNLDHRQVAKESLYEGSARIPLFIAGPNISSNIIKNLTESVDILPTLMSLGQAKSNQIPNWLTGSTLMPFLQGNIENNTHPKYITSQYHAFAANTGLFMVRKHKYKYIQYGHYLSAFKNYKPLLF